MSNGLQQMEEEQQQQQHSIQESNLSKESKVQPVFHSGITNTPYNTKIIIEKINFLITTLENDNDILIQDTKLDLILKYLEALDKLKIINSNSSSNSNSKET